MPSLAFRKASICSRFSFSASCTLVVNPQHATRSRLILCWKLSSPSGSSCIGRDYEWHKGGKCCYSECEVCSPNVRAFCSCADFADVLQPGAASLDWLFVIFNRGSKRVCSTLKTSQ